jgi:hypothetical protein
LHLFLRRNAQRCGDTTLQKDLSKVDDMHTSYSPATANEPNDKAGTLLSVVGLVAWLSAMMLAIAGPLLGVNVPPLLIVGMVVFSGAFSVLSLPKLIGVGKQDDAHHKRHA